MKAIMRSHFLLISALACLLLTAMPMPSEWLWYRPNWCALWLCYAITHRPEHFGLAAGWLVGILNDLIQWQPLGLHTLGYTTLAWLLLLFHQRLRMYSLLQQVVMVFVFIGLQNMLLHWMLNLLDIGTKTLMFFISPAISAAMWPVILWLVPTYSIPGGASSAYAR